MRRITARAIFDILSYRGFFRWIPSKIFLKLKYRVWTGKKLNLKNPQTFNEKLQWLKLFNAKYYDPIYTKLADKIEVKDIVAEKIGDEYIIPTLGIWDRFDNIDFGSLPNQFVLKTNNDSGGIVIVKDKSKLDKNAARKKLEKHRKVNFYWYGREPQYRNIKARIFAEKYMADESGVELKDYKIFNFDSEPKLIQVDYGRFNDHRRNLYTTDWNYLNVSIKYPTDPNHQIEQPKELAKMLEFAHILSRGMPHVRTDFYYCNDHIYFGELTFYHGSGFERFTPERLGEEMGEWIKLPICK